jgi:oligopeptide transport system substrate-binding protein
MRLLLVLVVLILAFGTTVPWWGTWLGTATTMAADTPRLAVAGFITLDPQQASSLEEFRLLDALCEPLVRLDPQSLRPQPALAERWQSDATGSVWTFSLRRAQWSDHTPVTAAQMVAGLQRHRQGSAASAALSAITDLAAPDEQTLIITCSRPQATLVEILSTPVFVPLHPAMSAPTAWTDPRRIIGNGPLQCVDFAPRHHLDLQPSPTYDGPSPARGALRLLLIDDVGTAVRLYLDHRVDAVLRLSADLIGDLRRSGSAILQSSASWGTEFYRLRVEAHAHRPQLARAVRRALARSVDRVALVHELLHDNGTPATTLVPSAADKLGYHPPLTVLAYDLAAAQRELTVAGLTQQTLPTLELVVPSNQPERLRIGEWLCDRWRRDLGLTVHVVAVPANLAHSRIAARDYDLARGSLIGDYLDPAYFLHCFESTSGMNRTGFADAGFDRLLLEAEADPQQRLALLAQAEARLLDAAPLVPLFHYACSFLVSSRLHGIDANLLEQVRYAEVGFSPATGALSDEKRRVER